MKMLMFDFRASEKEFFETHNYPDIEIEFIREPLNNMSSLTEKQLEETDIVSVFISSDVNSNVISKFKNLRIITTRSTGYDHIDTDYCKRNNIAVFNVEHYGEKAVAQFTFLLILALLRKIIPAYLDVQANVINYVKYEGNILSKKSIGILGCGSIGSAVAKIANFFGMKVYVCSYEKNPEISSFAEYVSFDKMLENSDILTLHIPYEYDSYHIINEKAFAKMKDGVYIINTARGELIDIVALYNNLLTGKVKGAALDVVECEKVAVCEKPIELAENVGCLAEALIIQKLLGREDVIITPHIAYNTYESVEMLLESTFISIRDYSKGLHTNQVV